MNVVYKLQGSEFEWDNAKSESNWQKHGVSFAEAAEVFFDPFYETGDATVSDEARSYIIGCSLTHRLLWAVFVERGVRTRIISARAATRAEKRIYEER